MLRERVILTLSGLFTSTLDVSRTLMISKLACLLAMWRGVSPSQYYRIIQGYKGRVHVHKCKDFSSSGAVPLFLYNHSHKPDEEECSGTANVLSIPYVSL